MIAEASRKGDRKAINASGSSSSRPTAESTLVEDRKVAKPAATVSTKLSKASEVHAEKAIVTTLPKASPDKPQE